MRIQVQPVVPESHRGGVAPRAAGPAHDGANPCEQLPRIERLGNVVVGAHLEPDDAIHILSLRRDDDDRRIRILL